MRVFSVEMLVKEEGAAVVQAALNRLKKETQDVAAQMKNTSQAVTGAGTTMKATGQAVEISGTKAAKAAIGFAAVGQTIARTGSLTADAGTRIVEAGSQIAAMFGPTGLVVSAVLAGLTAVTTFFFRAKAQAAELKKKLDELTNTANIQALQDELDKIIKGTAAQQGRDSITALATELARLEQGFPALEERMRRFGVLAGKDGETYRRVLELREAVKSQRDAIVDLQRRIALASDTERFHTKVVDAGAEAEKRATEALKARTRAMTEAEAAQKRAIQIRGAIQEREWAGLPQVKDIYGALSFGRGLESGLSERMAGAAAPGVMTSATTAFKEQLDADIRGITEQIANTQVAIDDAFIRTVSFDNIRETLGAGIASAVESGITSGLEMAIASGNIAEGFRAMGQAIVRSMASAMVKVALEAIKFGTLMDRIREFMILHPKTAVITAIALLALARSLGGSASGGGMTAVGGPGGLTYSASGPGMTSTLPTQQIIFGATSATTAAGMTPRQSMNVTVIGPNDPQAQRAIQELMTKADSRGRVG